MYRVQSAFTLDIKVILPISQIISPHMLNARYLTGSFERSADIASTILCESTGGRSITCWTHSLLRTRGKVLQSSILTVNGNNILKLVNRADYLSNNIVSNKRSLQASKRRLSRGTTCFCTTAACKI